jgi:hypothetical protein
MVPYMVSFLVYPQNNCWLSACNHNVSQHRQDSESFVENVEKNAVQHCFSHAYSRHNHLGGFKDIIIIIE